MNETQLGILINSPGSNQVAFTAINHVNTIHTLKLPINPCIFYRENTKHCTKLAGMSTTIDRIFNYYGHVIATNLDLAVFALNAKTPQSKTLYMFDLEWLTGYGNFVHNATIYNNPELIVIAPSKEYADALYNYCGRTANAIVPRFHIPTIVEVIKNEVCNRTQQAVV